MDIVTGSVLMTILGIGAAFYHLRDDNQNVEKARTALYFSVVVAFLPMLEWDLIAKLVN